MSSFAEQLKAMALRVDSLDIRADVPRVGVGEQLVLSDDERRELASLVITLGMEVGFTVPVENLDRIYPAWRDLV